MTAIKKLALREPLVDTVNANALVTTAHAFKTLDLLTVSKADLAFTSNFEIECERDDYVHAFVAYFDIDFKACHKNVYFSTGMHEKC